MLNKKMLGLALAALPLVALAAPAQAQVAGEKIQGSYICVFKKGSVGRGQAEAEAHRSVNAQGGQVKHVYRVALQALPPTWRPRRSSG